MTTFALTIDLGNEAMQTAAEVANALQGVCAHLEGSAATSFGGSIRDENGNTVGQYQVIDPPGELA